MNLGASFILEKYKKEFLEVLPYVNILFGNADVIIKIVIILIAYFLFAYL